MGRRSEAQLRPRNGSVLMAGIVARISGCAGQKEISLEDQVDHAKEEVSYLLGELARTMQVDYRIIATKAKGERLDRPELAEIAALLRSGTLDLFVMEDVGRLVRGAEAVSLWGVAVDHGTRCIAPNDCCDTADETWEQDLLNACAEHVAHNAHISKRGKYKKKNRFVKFGGSTPQPVAPYIKPPDAKTFDDWYRNPVWVDLMSELLRRLRVSLNCTAEADWLNERGVPVGPAMRGEKWTGPALRRLFRNPILKGTPQRCARHTVKHHETGRRVSRPNPDGPVFRACPHLAYLTPEEFDELNAALDRRNAGKGRKARRGTDPRAGVPRTRTRFPGQYARCWYCGSHFVWGANGAKDSLMCANSRQWHCWNSVGFDGPLAVERIVAAIMRELSALDGFDAQFAALVRAADESANGGLAEARDRLGKEEQSLAAQQQNLAEAIARCGPEPLLVEKLNELRSRETTLKCERLRLESLRSRPLALPQSVAELRGLFETSFARLAHDSPEFGDLLRQVVPEFRVHLVRLCDGGDLYPLARITLALDGLVPDALHVPDLHAFLARNLEVDLFDEVPQRVRIREEVARLTAAGKPQRAICRILDERPKLPTVQRAISLHRKMQELGLESPFELLLDPPDDYPKLRRHQNPKYRFQPIEGYERPPL